MKISFSMMKIHSFTNANIILILFILTDFRELCYANSTTSVGVDSKNNTKKIDLAKKTSPRRGSENDDPETEYLKLREQSNIYANNSEERPPYTFKRLIFQALLSSPDHKMTIFQMYNFVITKYPFYNTTEGNQLNWKHTLKNVLTRPYLLFKRCEKAELDNPNEKPLGPRACYWSFLPECKDKIYREAYQKGQRWFSNKNVK